MVSLAHGRQLEEILGERGVLLRGDSDLLDEIWHDRPSLPSGAIEPHASRYLDETRRQRLDRVRGAMAEHHADWHLVSTLDDIAWLTTLRGTDVGFNPVFLAHLLIGRATATLFVAPGKLAPAQVEALKADGVEVADYADWAARLSALPRDERVLIDPARLTLGTRQALPDEMAVVEDFQPSTLAKGIKTSHELGFVRQAMEADGAALCRFFAWLEAAFAASEKITELDVEARLYEERAKDEDFVCESFNTIAAFNANGALPHYRATPGCPLGNRRRRPVADRLRRPVPGRHHRYHSDGSGRHAQ